MKIKNCARCGGDHDEVESSVLEHPFMPPEAGGIAWTHWAPCPVNGQPILFVLDAGNDPRGADGRLDDVPDPVNGTDAFEGVLEWCYWRFDSLRAGTALDRKEAGLGPQAERDAYKAVLRAFYAKWRLAPPDSEPTVAIREL